MSDDDTPPKPRPLTRESLQVFTSNLPPRIPKSQQTYPYRVTITAPNDPALSKWTPYQWGKLNFEEFRFEQALIQREEEMKIHLEAEGVKDYKIERGDKSVEFYFPSQWASNIAKMAYLEDKTYTLSLLPENSDMSLLEVGQMMQSFQQEFNEAGFGNNVHLMLIAETREIRAIAANRRAFVDLLGDVYSVNFGAAP